MTRSERFLATAGVASPWAGYLAARSFNDNPTGGPLVFALLTLLTVLVALSWWLRTRRRREW